MWCDIESNISCTKSWVLTIFRNVPIVNYYIWRTKILEAVHTMLDKTKKPHYLPGVFNKKPMLNLSAFERCLVYRHDT